MFFAVLRNSLLPCQGLAKLVTAANSWSHTHQLWLYIPQEKALHLGKTAPAFAAAALHRELQHSQGSVFLGALTAKASAKTPAVGEDFLLGFLPGGSGTQQLLQGCASTQNVPHPITEGRKFHGQLLNTSHIPCFTQQTFHRNTRGPPLVPNGIFGDLKVLSWANQTGLLNPVTQLMKTATPEPA